MDAGSGAGDDVKVVIAGGSGSLGRRVAADFARRGDEVVILTRSPRPGIAHRQVEWDGRTVGPWASELEGAVVINLAGATIGTHTSLVNQRSPISA